MVTCEAVEKLPCRKGCTFFDASNFRFQTDEQLHVPVIGVFMDSPPAEGSAAGLRLMAHERVVSHAASCSAGEVDFRYFH